MSCQPSLSKSVFPSVHRATNVPAALLGGGATLEPPAGQSIWLRAQSESYSDGANVTQWSDISGNARHFTIGSNYPVFRAAANNGRAAIEFNGTNQGLNRSYTGSGTAYTVAAIVSKDSSDFEIFWHNAVNPYIGVQGGTNQVPRIFRGTVVDGTTKFPFTNWVPLLYRVTGTTAELFVGKTRVASGAVSSGALAVSGIGNQGGAFYWDGKMQEIIAYESALSDTAIEELADYLLQESGSSTTNAERQIICDGDSITAGFGSNLPAYPTNLQTLLGSGYTVSNFGIVGQTVVQMSSDAASQVHPILGTRLMDGRTPICIAWGGTNDIFFGANGTDTHTSFSTYCTNARNAGGKVIAINMLPRRTDQGSFNDTDWATFNSLFAANASSYSDAQIDMASILPDETDTDLYQDGIHPTTAGNVIIANTVKATLDAMIAAE